MAAQSQTYSDYKSTNTLKALGACDPRGSGSGSISDKELFTKSGLKSMLKDLISVGHLQTGDGIVADKGFDIHEEVEQCGLKLNIPPFARSGTQMSECDSLLTLRIAAHRVHVERLIAAIKNSRLFTDVFH